LPRYAATPACSQQRAALPPPYATLLYGMSAEREQQRRLLRQRPHAVRRHYASPPPAKAAIQWRREVREATTARHGLRRWRHTTQRLPTSAARNERRPSCRFLMLPAPPPSFAGRTQTSERQEGPLVYAKAIVHNAAEYSVMARDIVRNPQHAPAVLRRTRAMSMLMPAPRALSESGQCRHVHHAQRHASCRTIACYGGAA